MSCTVAVQWDNTKLHLNSADGNKTYTQGINYEITTGNSNVLIELIDIPDQTDLLLTSEEGFGKVVGRTDKSPYKQLNFKYELNG